MYMSEFSTNKRLYENISKMKLMLRSSKRYMFFVRNKILAMKKEILITYVFFFEKRHLSLIVKYYLI